MPKEPACAPGPACLDIGEVERRIARGLGDAFLHLRRAGPARHDAVAVVEAGGHLLGDHRDRPGPRADEAQVAAEHVEELRQLIQIPALEEPSARPGQILGLRLEESRVAADHVSREHLATQRPKLEKLELAAPRDAALAVEPWPTIPTW